MNTFGPRQCALIKSARSKTPLSQADLGEGIGTKKSQLQFISNIERGLCGVPPKHINLLCKRLNMPVERLIDAMVKDYEEALYKAVMVNPVPEEHVSESTYATISAPLVPAEVIDGTM